VIPNHMAAGSTPARRASKIKDNMAKRPPSLLSSEEQIAVELAAIIVDCRFMREELEGRPPSDVSGQDLKALVDAISGAVKLKLAWEESRSLQASKLSPDEELEVVAEYILGMTKQRRSKFMSMMTKKLPTLTAKEPNESDTV
jgi:protein involved in polysaccharide export with SLBB domain